MNVKDLILESVPTADDTTAITTTRKPRKAPQAPTWEVVLSDACDGAVRRKTAKTSRLLVLLLSQKQYYIKDEVSGEVEELNDDNLANFLKGNQNGIKVVPWATKLVSGTKHTYRFLQTIRDDDFVWLAKRGLHVYQYGNNSYEDNLYEIKRKRKSYDNPIRKAILTACTEAVGEERLKELMEGASARSEQESKVVRTVDRGAANLECINAKFGLDWTRQYLREFLTSPFVGSSLVDDYNMSSLLQRCEYEPGRFIDYLFHDSVAMGYGIVLDDDYGYYSRSAYDIRHFVQDWRDTLQMQYQLRGKVWDKYPTNLSELHMKLSFKVQLNRHRIDEDAFKNHAERLDKKSFKDTKYLIRPPYNKGDMTDEASQQANCLASYIDAFARNDTDIYFMRSVDDPEKSLVTVEVRGNKVRQAYRAYNRQPSDEELEWLEKWCKRNNIAWFDAEHQRPLCA